MNTSGPTNFDGWASRNPFPTRGKGGTTVIDQAPRLLAELPDYFVSLTPERLARCWVACLVDAAEESDFTPGDVARALVVVADRLHGIRFGDPVYAANPAALEKLTMSEPEGAGFEVKTGLPPPPKRASGKGFDPMTLRMRALQVGEFMVIKADRIKKTSLPAKLANMNKEPEQAGKPRLRYYTIASGDFVVIRDAVEAAK